MDWKSRKKSKNWIFNAAVKEYKNLSFGSSKYALEVVSSKEKCYQKDILLQKMLGFESFLYIVKK